MGVVAANLSQPQTELKNVAGQIWIDDKYLSGVYREPGERYDEHQFSGRWELNFNYPVVPKTASKHFPSWILRLPDAGDEIIFGAQITSAEIDKEEYIWKIVNELGKPRIVWIRSPYEIE